MKEHGLDLEKLREAQRLLSKNKVTGPHYTFAPTENDLRVICAFHGFSKEWTEDCVRRWKDNEMGSVYLGERE